MAGGQYARRVMSEKAFKRGFFVGLIALGAYMAASGWLYAGIADERDARCP